MMRHQQDICPHCRGIVRQHGPLVGRLDIRRQQHDLAGGLDAQDAGLMIRFDPASLGDLSLWMQHPEAHALPLPCLSIGTCVAGQFRNR